jgi:predicted transposase YbfD/YdcC
MALLIKNKLAEKYINEIIEIKQKLKGIKLKKSEVVLNALQTEYIESLREILASVKKEEIYKFVNDKDLLKRHII